MKKYFKNFFVGLIVVASIVSANTTLAPSPTYAAACKDTSFFVIPNWWRGLGKTSNATGKDICVIDITAKGGSWQTGVLTIALNVIDGLLRLAGLIAVFFIILGGIRYIISQGESSGISAAKQTITRAVIGLVIAISSVLILNYIAGTVFRLTVNQDNFQVTGTGSGDGNTEDFGGGGGDF